MIHEANRVFRDRLVDDGDRSWFDQQVDAICTEEIGTFPRFLAQFARLHTTSFIRQGSRHVTLSAAAATATGCYSIVISLRSTTKA